MMKIAKTYSCTLAVTLCAAALAEGVKPNRNDAGRLWIDVGGKDVEGRGWSDAELPFDRIPKRFAKDLPRVWENGI